MSTPLSSASAYFPRPAMSGAVAHLCMAAAAAGMTAMLWASALGAGDQPTAYLAAAASGSQARNVVHVTLQPVTVVARRDAAEPGLTQVAARGGDVVASTGCTADRAAHKPG